MKSKLRIYLYILLVSFGYLFAFNLPIKSNNDQSVISINKDYLKINPSSRYIVDSGDTLQIDISLDYPELLSVVTIDGEGKITLPSLGSIYVRGLTLVELNKILNEAYLEFVKYPKVTSIITNYRPISINVEGEVNSPGIQTLNGSLKTNFSETQSLTIQNEQVKDINSKNFNNSLKNQRIIKEISFYFPTVFDAIRASGGITPLSDLSNIEIIRKNPISEGGGLVKASLNFTQILSKKSISQNIRIYDGDTILINKLETPNKSNLSAAVASNLNPKYIQVYVTGNVINPGSMIISASATLNDAIDVAGGTKALRGKIDYLTFVNDGSIRKTTINYRKNNKRGAKNNPYLKDGDLIFVDRSIFGNTADVITEVTKPFQGIYSTYRLIQLIGE